MSDTERIERELAEELGINLARLIPGVYRIRRGLHELIIMEGHAPAGARVELERVKGIRDTSSPS